MAIRERIKSDYWLISNPIYMGCLVIQTRWQLVLRSAVDVKNRHCRLATIAASLLNQCALYRISWDIRVLGNL
jgi:hypothetical protein